MGLYLVYNQDYWNKKRKEGEFNICLSRIYTYTNISLLLSGHVYHLAILSLDPLDLLYPTRTTVITTPTLQIAKICVLSLFLKVVPRTVCGTNYWLHHLHLQYAYNILIQILVRNKIKWVIIITKWLFEGAGPKYKTLFEGTIWRWRNCIVPRDERAKDPK